MVMMRVRLSISCGHRASNGRHIIITVTVIFSWSLYREGVLLIRALICGFLFDVMAKPVHLLLGRILIMN